MMTEMLHLKRVPSEERKSEYYAVMLDETEHLSHLIDNILDFSRIEDERKKYHFDELDLNYLLVDFLDNYRKRLTDPGFNITYDSSGQPALLQADKEALHQVFYNLLDNAVKYSGESRKVDVKLSTSINGYNIYVKDYGIGISRKDQEKIFERFYRSDEPQMMGIKGSGIGLTIVKRIIDSHEGRLTVESRPGEGSTFCVYLPVSKKIEQ
jgi:two-component system phosphate regulon sensor histidine kinase PhoR